MDRQLEYRIITREDFYDEPHIQYGIMVNKSEFSYYFINTVRSTVYVNDTQIHAFKTPPDKKLILHKEDGPAWINNGSEEWFYYGKWHRYDGPCYREREHEISDEQWAIHGHSVDRKKYLAWLDESGMDIENLTPEDKILIDLKWGPK